MEELGTTITILFAGVLMLFVGIVLGKKNDSSGINGLAKKVRTEKNADRVDRLIYYHNSRMKHGADEKESLARLERELKELHGEQ